MGGRRRRGRKKEKTNGGGREERSGKINAIKTNKGGRRQIQKTTGRRTLETFQTTERRRRTMDNAAKCGTRKQKEKTPRDRRQVGKTIERITMCKPPTTTGRNGTITKTVGRRKTKLPEKSARGVAKTPTVGAQGT